MSIVFQKAYVISPRNVRGHTPSEVGFNSRFTAKNARLAVALLASFLVNCGSPASPADDPLAEYECADGQKLALLLTPDHAILRMENKTYNLQVRDGFSGKYANGSASLEIHKDEATFSLRGRPVFSRCKKRLSTP